MNNFLNKNIMAKYKTKLRCSFGKCEKKSKQLRNCFNYFLYLILLSYKGKNSKFLNETFAIRKKNIAFLKCSSKFKGKFIT